MLDSSSSSIDFGLVYYAADLPPTVKPFNLRNNSDWPLKICSIARGTSTNDFPATVKIVDEEGLCDFDDDADMQMIVNILIPPKQNKQVTVIFSPLFLDRNPKLSERTSFVNISTDIDLLYRIETDTYPSAEPDLSLRLAVSATLCTSILFVDDGEIEFINCLIGNTCVRDIQIWNRSECSLSFRICEETEKNVQHAPGVQLTFLEFDNNRVLPIGCPIQIAAFASMRVRVSFRAEVLGEGVVSYRLENLNNPSNVVTINCKINVISKEESEAISLELESGEVVDASQVLELGDCYCGLVMAKRLWIRNNSLTNSIIMMVGSDRPSEVSFDLSGHVDEGKLMTVSTATNRAIAAAAAAAIAASDHKLFTDIEAGGTLDDVAEGAAVGADDLETDEAGTHTRVRMAKHRTAAEKSSSSVTATAPGGSMAGSVGGQGVLYSGHVLGQRDFPRRTIANDFGDADEGDGDDEFDKPSSTASSSIVTIPSDTAGRLAPAASQVKSVGYRGGGNVGLQSSKADVWGAPRSGSSIVVDIGRMGAFGSRGWIEETEDNWYDASEGLGELRWFLGSPRSVESMLAEDGNRIKSRNRSIEWNPSSWRHSMTRIMVSDNRHEDPHFDASSVDVGPPSFAFGEFQKHPNGPEATGTKLVHTQTNKSDRKSDQWTLLLEPGARKPITLLFCPSSSKVAEGGREKDQQVSSWTQAVTSGNTLAGSDPSTSTLEGRVSDAVVVSAPAPTTVDAGALVQRTVKLSIKWKVKGRRGSFVEDTEHSYSTQDDTDYADLVQTSKSFQHRRISFGDGSTSFGTAFITDAALCQRESEYHTRLVICRGRACLSLITVTPAVNDLGECSVGDFRSALFTVSNGSDLPAFVVPHVESETLSVAVKDREVHIPARSSRQIQLDYVARLENTNYKRSFEVLNAYNPSGNALLEVRAKNVDTHQVLLHSAFYKILTHNTKRQLQVYFDRCLFNVPSLRVFSIRNIHEHPLVLQIHPAEDSADIKLFRISARWEDVDQADDDRTRSNTAGGARERQANRLLSLSMKNESIEDLKWGSPLGQQQTGMVRSKSAYQQFEGDQPSHTTIYGDLHVPMSLTADSIAVSGDETSQTQSLTVLKQEPVAGLGVSTEVRNARDRLQEKGGTGQRVAMHESSSESSQLTVDYVSLFNQDNFPFSLITQQLHESNRRDGDAVVGDGSLDTAPATSSRTVDVSNSITPTGENGNETADTVAEMGSIRLIQRCYHGLRSLIESKTDLLPLERPDDDEEVGGIDIDTDTTDMVDRVQTASEGSLSPRRRKGCIVIPVGKTENFAVLIEPQGDRNSKELLSEVTLTRSITLKLLSVTTSDLQRHESFVDHDKHASEAAKTEKSRDFSKPVVGEPLKPRSLLIRAKATLTAMSISQKNFNFGRVVIGETVSRNFNIVNESSAPLLYSVSKSGSFSSGFVKLPSGRKGIIASYGTQTIEFVFKPTLPGPFEITLLVENVLDPGNNQSIIVKAKVVKPETFQLLPYPLEPPTSISTAPTTFVKASVEDTLVVKAESVVTATAHQLQPLTLASSDSPLEGRQRLNSVDSHVSQQFIMREFLEKMLAQQDIVEGTTVKPKFLGETAVGEVCESAISFRIRNMTPKPRQFIVDASHADAVVLLPEFLNSRPSRRASEDPVGGGVTAGTVDHSTLSMTTSVDVLDSGGHSPLHPIPFEPIPETLQSIVSARCRFEKFNLADLVLLPAVSSTEEQKLRDDLEKFQQKLKIAKRKNKDEKIVKYEKKVYKTMKALGQDVSKFEWSEGNGPDGVAGGKEEENEADSDDGKVKDKEKEKDKEKKNKDKDGSITLQADVASNTGKTLELESSAPPPAPNPSTIAQNASVQGQPNADVLKTPQPLMVTTRSASTDRLVLETPGEPTAKSVVGESDITFHFVVGPDQDAVIQVKLRFLPGVSYRHWSGALPFRGNLRVFECRNEDLVKTVEFGAMIYPSRHSMIAALGTDAKPEANQASTRAHEQSIFSAATLGATSSPGKTLKSETGGMPVNLSSLGVSLDDELLAHISSVWRAFQNPMGLLGMVIPQQAPPVLAAPVPPTSVVTDSSNVFITTVAQWCSFPTKQLISTYRQSSFNILGVTLKLVQASRDGVMRGSISLTSLVGWPSTAKVSIVDDCTSLLASAPITESSAANALLVQSQHGPVLFSASSQGTMLPICFTPTGRNSKEGNSTDSSVVGMRSDASQLTHAAEVKTEGATNTDPNARHLTSTGSIRTEIPAGGKVEFLVQWQPAIEIREKVLLVGFICVSMEFTELAPLTSSGGISNRPGTSWTSSQYVPVVCFLEHKSSFKVDKYLNLGEVPLGTVKTCCATLTNTSDKDDFHYVTMLVETTMSARTVGKVDISQGYTGILPPQGSKDIMMDFSATSIGKFEQELWINNLNDRFDQKRVAVVANVILAQSQFVKFPDLKYDESTGKLEHLNFGLIQIQGHALSSASLYSYPSTSSLQAPSASLRPPIIQPSMPNLPTIFSLSVGALSETVKVTTEDVLSIGRHRAEFCCRLRVLNVSEKQLTVTAVSNLKSQCFIFADAECTLPVVAFPVSRFPSAPSVLYIVVRPAPFTGDQWSAATGTGGARINAGPGGSSSSGGTSAVKSADKAERAALVGRELVGGIRLVFFDTGRPCGRAAYDAVANSLSTLKPRTGADSTTTSSSVATSRKLFETTVVFKATVGYSLLRVRTPLRQPQLIDKTGLHASTAVDAPIDPRILTKETIVSHATEAPASGAPDKRQQDLLRAQLGSNVEVKYFKQGKHTGRLGVVIGRIILENISPTFSLRYRYLWGHCGCISSSSGLSVTEVIDEVLTRLDKGILPLAPSKEKTLKPFKSSNEVPGWTPSDSGFLSSGDSSKTHLVFFDHPECLLEAGELVAVPYGILFPVDIAGVVVHNVAILNASTGDVQRFALSAFFDDGRLRTNQISSYSSSLLRSQPSLTSSYPSNGPQGTSNARDPGVKTEQIKKDDGGVQDGSVDIPAVTAWAPIWMTPNDAYNLRPSSGGSHMQRLNPPLFLTQSKFDVVGSARELLSSWIVANASDKPISVMPVSNLPLSIKLQLLEATESLSKRPSRSSELSRPVSRSSEATQEEERRSSPLLMMAAGTATVRGSSGDHLKQKKLATGTSYPSLISATGTDWKGGLHTCGESLTVPPGASFIVYVKSSNTIVAASVIRSSDNENTTYNPSQSAVTDALCRVLCYSSGTSPDWAESGMIRRVEGVVSLVPSASLIQSFYDPVHSTPLSPISGTSEAPQIALKPTQRSVNSLASMFDSTEQPLSGGRITSPSTLPPLPPSTKDRESPSQLATTQKQTKWPDCCFLPLMTLTKLICDFVVCKINVPVTSFNLGTLRCNRTTSFVVVVESHCDVEVPVRLESLPSWMDIFVAPRRKPARKSARIPSAIGDVMGIVPSAATEAGAALPRGDSLSLSEVSMVEDSVFWTSDVDGVGGNEDEEELNAHRTIDRETPTTDFALSARTSSRTESSVGALKLKKWLESRSSDQNKASAKRRPSGILSLESLAAANETNAISGSKHLGDDKSEMEVDAEDPELTQFSLEVAADGSVDNDFEDSSTILRQAHRTSNDSSVSPIFSVPRRGKLSIRVRVRAPTIGSQTLEHVLQLRNLAAVRPLPKGSSHLQTRGRSHTSSTALAAEEPSNLGSAIENAPRSVRVPLVEMFELKVRLDVDSSVALGITNSAGEMLSQYHPNGGIPEESSDDGDIDGSIPQSDWLAIKRPYVELPESIIVPVPPSPSLIMSSIEKSFKIDTSATSNASPGAGVILPACVQSAPAVLEGENETIEKAITHPQKATIVASEDLFPMSKSLSGCGNVRLGIKNLLGESIKVLATFEVHAQLAGLITMKFLYQGGGMIPDQTFDLMFGEATQLRIVISSTLESRLDPEVLEKLTRQFVSSREVTQKSNQTAGRDRSMSNASETDKMSTVSTDLSTSAASLSRQGTVVSDTHDMKSSSATTSSLIHAGPHHKYGPLVLGTVKFCPRTSAMSRLLQQREQRRMAANSPTLFNDVSNTTSAAAADISQLHSQRSVAEDTDLDVTPTATSAEGMKSNVEASNVVGSALDVDNDGNVKKPSKSSQQHTMRGTYGSSTPPLGIQTCLESFVGWGDEDDVHESGRDFSPEQDAVCVDIIGYLIAGPTGYAVASISTQVVPHAGDGYSSMTKGTRSEVVELDDSSPIADTSTGVGTSLTVLPAVERITQTSLLLQKNLRFLASAQTVGDTTTNNLSRAPVLFIKENFGQILLVNPSTSRPLKFYVNTYPHRHPGMRLLLSSHGGESVNGIADDAEDDYYCRPGSVDADEEAVFGSVDLIRDHPNHADSQRSRASKALYRARRISIPDGMYDTVIPHVFPDAGTIAPGGMQELGVKLVPGSSAGTVGASDKGTVGYSKTSMPLSFEFPEGLNLIACMSLEIFDENSPHHLPTVIQTVLLTDTKLPVVLTQPVSDINRRKVHLDSVARNNTMQGEGEDRERSRQKDRGEQSRFSGLSDDNTLGGALTRTQSSRISETADGKAWASRLITGDLGNTNDFALRRRHRPGLELLNTDVSHATIRLRGLTPCLSSVGQYEIQLGQQLNRPEALEWLLTLENRSDLIGLSFTISSMTSSGDDWIFLGQTRGEIAPCGSASVMLYFSRQNIGVFSTYLIVQNLINRGDIQVVRVSMEVVQDVSRRLLGPDGLPIPVRPLFQVVTAEMRWLRQKHKFADHQNANAFPRDNHKLEPLNVDYGDVYIGRQYRRRSILLENLSDSLHLDFQLSSSLSPEELTFTLSPLSLKPCWLVTLAPREVKPVFLVFRPQLPSQLSANKGPTGVTDLEETSASSQTSPLLALSKGWDLRGEVYVACRLVRDHQETIRLKACSRLPSLKVSLELPPVHSMSRCGTSVATMSERLVVDTSRSVHDNVVQLASEMNVDIGANVVTSTAERSVPSLKTSSALSGSATALQWQPAAWIRADHGSRWINAEHVCIRNRDTSAPIEVTIYCIMRLFHVRIINVLDSSGRSRLIASPRSFSPCDGSEEPSGEPNCNGEDPQVHVEDVAAPWSPVSRGVLLGPSVAHVCIPAGGCIWLRVEPTSTVFSAMMARRSAVVRQEIIPEVVDSTAADNEHTAKTTKSTAMMASTLLSEFSDDEDHFTVYRKYNLTERYRIPVRLNPMLLARLTSPINPSSLDSTKSGGSAESTGDEVRSAQLIQSVETVKSGADSNRCDLPTNEHVDSQLVLATFSSFEAAIASFLRQYYAMWADVMALADLLHPQPIPGAFSVDDNDDSVPMTGEDEGEDRLGSQTAAYGGATPNRPIAVRPVATPARNFPSLPVQSSAATPVSTATGFRPASSPSPPVGLGLDSSAILNDGTGSWPPSPTKPSPRAMKPPLIQASSSTRQSSRSDKLRVVVDHLVTRGHLVLTEGAIFSVSLSLSSTLPSVDDLQATSSAGRNRVNVASNQVGLANREVVDVEGSSGDGCVQSKMRNQPIATSGVTDACASDDDDIMDDESAAQLEPLAAAVGAALAETFFHFFALTDQLTLHSLKQAVIEGQPASRLALLLYSVVFKHPVFEGYISPPTRLSSGRPAAFDASKSGSGGGGPAGRDEEQLRGVLNAPQDAPTWAAPLPPVLVPFAKQLLYYLGFFPEVSVTMEPLVEVSERLRACLLARERFRQRQQEQKQHHQPEGA